MPEALGPANTVRGSNSNSAYSMLRKFLAHTFVIVGLGSDSVAIVPILDSYDSYVPLEEKYSIGVKTVSGPRLPKTIASVSHSP